MEIEQPALPVVVEFKNDLQLMATAIAKLDKFFENRDMAKAYLTPEGGLNKKGLMKLQAHWNGYSLCATLMMSSAHILPKTQEVVDVLQEAIVAPDCKVYISVIAGEKYFAVNARHFFWLGTSKP